MGIWSTKPTLGELGINGQRLSICNVDWNNGGGANDWEWSIMYGGTNHWTFTPTRTENAWMHIVYTVLVIIIAIIDFIKMVEVLLVQTTEVVDTEDLQEMQLAATLLVVRTGMGGCIM